MGGEARAAIDHDDVPVGAVVVRDGETIAARHNERERLGDPVAHAEVLALRDAAERLGRWRLDDCTLYVTLEPCAMCAGAMVNARLGRLVYAAVDPKAGAVDSHYQLLRGDKPGAELKFEFEGRAVGAFLLAGPDAGIVETKIDDGPLTKHDLFHRFSGGLNYPRSVIFAADLDPGKHVLTLRISEDKNPKSKGNTASILFFEVNR